MKYGALKQPRPYISPNGQYVVYDAYRNFEQDIFVYDIKTGKTINLTNSGVTETEPFWSPDGKYIYFTSSRTQPRLPLRFARRAYLPHAPAKI